MPTEVDLVPLSELGLGGDEAVERSTGKELVQ
jgi:hypothetical protein